MLGSDADIDFALADCGEQVTYGAQSCQGLLDRMPINELDDSGLRQVGERITLTIRHDALANITDDSDITVGGVEGGTFVIRDPGTPGGNGLRVMTLVEA